MYCPHLYYQSLEYYQILSKFRKYTLPTCIGFIMLISSKVCRWYQEVLETRNVTVQHKCAEIMKEFFRNYQSRIRLVEVAFLCPNPQHPNHSCSRSWSICVVSRPTHQNHHNVPSSVTTLSTFAHYVTYKFCSTSIATRVTLLSPPSIVRIVPHVDIPPNTATISGWQADDKIRCWVACFFSILARKC